MATLKELVDQITFNISETTDLNNKAANALFSNSNIIKQLKFALDKYSSHTLAYERIWSAQASTSDNVISAPPRIIRSQGIKFMMLFHNGFKFPMVDKDHSNVYNAFPVDNISGISTWFLYWGKLLQVFSKNSLDPLSSTLASEISDIDTTITLTDTIALPLYNGRISIGSEKIYFKRRTNNILYECERGAEDTTAASHSQLATVTENNLHIFYYSLYEVPDIPSDDRLTLADKNRDYDIPEEHIEPICDYATWKLLSKIDPGRAGFYKFNWDEWLEEAKFQIAKGRSIVTQTDDVRDPFYFEQDVPYVGL